MRTARAHPVWSAEAIAAAVGCHASTVRKHLVACHGDWHQIAVTADASHDRARLSREPQTSAHLLARLARDPDAGIREAVPEHDAAAPATLARLTRDPNSLASDTAASHPACPQAILHRLAANPEMAHAVSRNPHCPSRLLDRLASHPNGYVRATAIVHQAVERHDEQALCTALHEAAACGVDELRNTQEWWDDVALHAEDGTTPPEDVISLADPYAFTNDVVVDTGYADDLEYRLRDIFAQAAVDAFYEDAASIGG